MNPAPPQQQRLWWIAGVFASLFALVAARLADLQVIHPRRPSEASGANPNYQVIRPGRRGSLLGANGELLAVSRLVVTVRADPRKLGQFTPEVASLLAESLGLPQAEALARLQPVPLHTGAPPAALSTNSAAEGLAKLEERIRRNNGVATNIPIEAWEPLAARLHTTRFAAEQRLEAACNSASNALIAVRAQNPIWRLRTRMVAVREARSRLTEARARLKALSALADECRANGVYGETIELRVYPREYQAAHVLGFTTNAPTAAGGAHGAVTLAGAAGLEQHFDQELRGDNGRIEGSRWGGRELVPLRRLDMPAREGLSIVLNLDANIQSFAEEALDKAMDSLRPKAMSIIVVRPRDGAVLALANRPTYNPNDRRGATMDSLQNRAIMAPAEPGSTFKLVTYSAALDLGLVTLESPINCEGGRWLPPGVHKPVNDDQGHHLHAATVGEAFAFSSNVGASKLGLEVGAERFRGYMLAFGFLERTGIECAETGEVWRQYPTNAARASKTNTPGAWHKAVVNGEARGGVPRWDAVTQTRLPYGYGLYATPLQTCMAAAAIANGGVLMAPRLVQRMIDAEGRVVAEFRPKVVRRVIQAATAKTMMRAMRLAVVEGTGKSAALVDYAVCGKTGTSRKVEPHAPGEAAEYSSTLYYASFVGFFPAESPEVCIMVNADEPTTAGKSYYGGKACAPVFQALAGRIASYLALPPDNLRPDSNVSGAAPEITPAPVLAGHP